MKLTFILLILFSAFSSFAQKNIADARTFRDGDYATISGIVTNGSELGPIRYMQDESAGIALYDDKLSAVKRGDSITVTGQINPYNNLFEVTKISSLIIHDAGKKLPAAKIISAGEISESYEGQLLRINNVKFETPGGIFSGDKNYNLVSGGKTFEIRISKNSSAIVGTPIPAGTFNLVAICSQYRDSYQLLPRDLNDFILADAINYKTPVNVSGISQSGLTLSWVTDVEAKPNVKYRLTDPGSGWKFGEDGISQPVADGFLNTVKISGLKPSEFIEAMAVSVAGTDTVHSASGIYATQSASSGEIRVYFNTPVKTAVSMGKPAQFIGQALEDTVIAFINRATETIDFCLYNFNNSGLSNISTALNQAKNRGVKVRVIVSGNTTHPGTKELDPSIGVLESPYSAETGIMHNKFILFDAGSANPIKPWVWTGSTNLSEDQVNYDANNVIMIQDQSLAKTYQVEFEEMWGTTALQPDKSKAKFGVQKTDNTPHFFNISGKLVECYFSPTDGTNQKIIGAIRSADNDLNVETMLITRTDLASEIVAAQQRGVNVHVITDNMVDNGTTINDILSKGLPQGKAVFDSWANGLMHHKLAIADANFKTSDPLVITGSHNWSYSADNLNDENTLIIHDAEIANLFFQQFAYRFEENKGSLFVKAISMNEADIRVFPNPANDFLQIHSGQPIQKIRLFTANGQLLKENQPGSVMHFNLDIYDCKSGIFLLQLVLENGKSESFKVIKK